MDYRHELKFFVSETELEIIKYRLKLLMRQDVHQKKGSYIVRSLYFDDFYNSCMQENEDGTDNRKKYRIRVYDGDLGVIKLEKKMKCRSMTRKVSQRISREDCLSYMSGRPPGLSAESSELEKEIYGEMRTRGMHPVCIVEYERTAFVEPKGNVRITFDKNISGNEKINGFLDKKVQEIPLLPKGSHILEVKYDEMLPDYIAWALEIGTLQRTSFSKYFYARNYKTI